MLLIASFAICARVCTSDLRDSSSFLSSSTTRRSLLSSVKCYLPCDNCHCICHCSHQLRLNSLDDGHHSVPRYRPHQPRATQQRCFDLDFDRVSSFLPFSIRTASAIASAIVFLKSNFSSVWHLLVFFHEFRCYACSMLPFWIELQVFCLKINKVASQTDDFFYVTDSHRVSRAMSNVPRKWLASSHMPVSWRQSTIVFQYCRFMSQKHELGVANILESKSVELFR